MKVIPKFQEGNKLTRDQKIKVLSNTYHRDVFYNGDNPSPIYNKEQLNDLPDIYLNSLYENTQRNPQAYVHSPSGIGPTIEGYAPLKLRTWYPFVHPYYDNDKDDRFWLTGHSALGFITKRGNEGDYNIAFNNCSDETRRALEAIFNKKLNPFIFTTPGDVRDFAKENGGYSKDSKDRTIYIPMNKERYDRYHQYIKTRRK